jgi:hypothetical protein
VSEWFGHRMYPKVVHSKDSVADQRSRRCPFLSDSTGTDRECIKSSASKDVCTISSVSNAIRQDWVVCPYRAFDRSVLISVAMRLYSHDAKMHLFPAPILADKTKQSEVANLLKKGEKVLVYFDQKMGGEISVSATKRSPEIAFDTTFVEISRTAEGLLLGRFAVMEIQTMDFHGSYRKVVENLSSALRLHKDDFPKQLQKNTHWLSENIEGPNIANVFKRTFWQLMFKFEMATSPGCAGVALAIPTAVWDSWQKFLGAPELLATDDKLVFSLQPADKVGAVEASWLYIFDLDGNSKSTPSPLRINKIIHTSATSLARYALEEAPREAVNQLELGIYPALRSRIRKFWSIKVDVPAGRETGRTVSIVDPTGPID